MKRHPNRMRKSVPAVVVALGLALIGCRQATSDSSSAPANRPSDSSSSDQPGNSPSDSSSSDQPGNRPSDSPSSDQPGNRPSDSPSSDLPPPVSPPTTSRPAVTPSGATRAPAPAAKSRIGGDGIYRVGADIEPGTYRSPGPSGSACYWARLDAQDEILDNSLTRGPSVVIVQPTDAAVETANCQPFTKG
jgi:hypothetical protein